MGSEKGAAAREEGRKQTEKREEGREQRGKSAERSEKRETSTTKISRLKYAMVRLQNGGFERPSGLHINNDQLVFFASWTHP